MKTNWRARINKAIDRIVVKEMREVLSNYQEPQRKGTPKGEPIGFSKKKLEVVLFLASGLPYENKIKLAESLGVKYGVLRKWASERRVKEHVQKYGSDFESAFYFSC